MDKSNKSGNRISIFKTFIIQKISTIKNLGTIVWKNAKPFLALKFWSIYLLSFSLGLYLWGPTHGWQKFRNWEFQQTQHKDKIPTTETLQQQLNQLQLELKIAKGEKKVAEFDPDTFSRPALGQIVRGFDWVETGKSWRLHTGVDIGLPPGSNVIAAAAGDVTEIKEFTPGGYSVTVSHGDGWKSTYSNLAKVIVTEGQSIIKGVIIGTSNNIGCDPQIASFHFAIYRDQQPIDPEKVISGLLK